ncbi:MAG: hypothetical protein KDD67_06610 [Ignavibacteriae bacterium]|nr:hypothetical protein [Ignavibacteriota bacterium]MCB9215608.1 hypothetical protein [Ignavibacteria bacterium]
MKRQILLLAPLIVIPTFLSAQQFLLQGEDTPPWKSDVSFILPGHDNSFWFFGIRYTSFEVHDADSRILISRLDYKGNVLMRSGLSGRFVSDVVQLNSGDFILSVDGPGIIRCDSTGQIKWGMKWTDSTDPSSAVNYVHAMVLSDDSTLFMLRNLRSDLSLYKLSTNGEVLSGKMLNVEKSNFHKMLATDDGGVLILASQLNISGPMRSVILVRTNEEGEVIWKKHYSIPNLFGMNDIAIRDNGNIVFFGSTLNLFAAAILIEFDPLGDPIRSTAYTSLGFIRDGRIALTDTDTYLFASSSDDSGWHASVTRVDSLGLVVSAYDYGETDKGKLTLGIITTPEGFVAAAIAGGGFPYFIVERGVDEGCDAYRREFTSTAAAHEATPVNISVAENPLEWSLKPMSVLPLSVDLLTRRYLCQPSGVDEYSTVGERGSKERILCRRGEGITLPLGTFARVERVLFYDLLGQLQAELSGENVLTGSDGTCHLKLPPEVLGYAQVVVERGSERSLFSLLVE